MNFRPHYEHKPITQELLDHRTEWASFVLDILEIKADFLVDEVPEVEL